MASTLLFSPPVILRTTKNRSLRSINTGPTCTLSPERPQVSEKRRSNAAPVKKYRVIPDDLPKAERPPSPPYHISVPFFGFFVEMALGLPMVNANKRRQRYGPIYQADYFFGLKTYIADYDTIVDMMRDPDLFRSRDALAVFNKLFGEDAIITLDGKEHYKVRTSLAPAFAPALFPYYFDRVLARARKTWEKAVAMKARGEELRLDPIFRQNYLSMVVEMTTGVDMDGENSAEIRELFRRTQSALFSPQFGPAWESGKIAHKELMLFLREVVQKNLSERADTIEKLREFGDDIVKLGMKNIGRDGVDVLLVAMANSELSTEKGAQLDEEIIDSFCRSMILLWFAGYATAAAASMCASFGIGFDDEVRSKLIEEQEKIIQTTNDGDRTLTYAQVSQMPLLDSFLLEMMRMHAPGSGANRKTSRDVEILGHFVPKDTIVYCDFDGAMYDPKVYPEPHTMKMDRFLKKDGVTRPAPTVLAFGAPGSAHFCLGAAFAKVLIKTTIATLLRDYEYTLDPSQSKEYNIIPEATPKSGVVVDTFERRSV